MKKNLTIAATLLIFLLSINSCKKNDTTINNSANNLLGTWKKPYQSYIVGITFTSDGKFSFGVYSGSTFVETITGNWSADNGGHVTFSNQSGSMEACPNTTAIYDYTIANNSLVFAVNTDPCSGRSDKVGGAYSKQ